MATPPLLLLPLLALLSLGTALSPEVLKDVVVLNNVMAGPNYYILQLQVCDGNRIIKGLRTKFPLDNCRGAAFDAALLEPLRPQLDKYFPPPCAENGEDGDMHGKILLMADSDAPGGKKEKRSAHEVVYNADAQPQKQQHQQGREGQGEGKDGKGKGEEDSTAQHDEQQRQQNAGLDAAGIGSAPPRGPLPPQPPSPHMAPAAAPLAPLTAEVVAFWKNEWESSGICTGLSQYDYFVTVLKLFRNHAGSGQLQECFDMNLSPISCPVPGRDISML